MNLTHFYRMPALTEAKQEELLSSARTRISSKINRIETEYCFNIESVAQLSSEEMSVLRWLLSETFEPENFSDRSFLKQRIDDKDYLIEVGPRMNFTTAWSTNAVAICNACGLNKIKRIERSCRYIIKTSNALSREQIESFTNELHDRMTACLYDEPLETFQTGIKPEPVIEIPLIEDGKSAIEKINIHMGLGLDEWDKEYYYNLFVNDIRRNPTNVECFDLSQSNNRTYTTAA
jgi:phosphoribosylformylglycinamidine synthase